MVITASGDRTTKLWDTRQPRSTNTFAVHGHEVLTADWNKYNPNIFASGSVDKTIKIMDIRQPQRPIRSMHGHNYAVKRLKFSPHSETQLASCS
jgi:peroxin-7